MLPWPQFSSDFNLSLFMSKMESWIQTRLSWPVLWQHASASFPTGSSLLTPRDMCLLNELHATEGKSKALVFPLVLSAPPPGYVFSLPFGWKLNNTMDVLTALRHETKRSCVLPLKDQPKVTIAPHSMKSFPLQFVSSVLETHCTEEEGVDVTMSPVLPFHLP